MLSQVPTLLKTFDTADSTLL